MSKMHAFIAILTGTVCMSVETAQNAEFIFSKECTQYSQENRDFYEKYLKDLHMGNEKFFELTNFYKLHLSQVTSIMLSQVENEFLRRESESLIPSTIVQRWLDKDFGSKCKAIGLNPTDNNYEGMDNEFRLSLQTNGDIMKAFESFKGYINSVVLPFLIQCKELEMSTLHNEFNSNIHDAYALVAMDIYKRKLVENQSRYAIRCSIL